MRIFGKAINIAAESKDPLPLAPGGWGLWNSSVITPTYYYNFVEFVTIAKCVFIVNEKEQNN